LLSYLRLAPDTGQPLFAIRMADRHKAKPMTARAVNKADVETIRMSGLFDAEFYSSRVGIRPSDPILHYLQKGEARGIPPSDKFDPVFYRVTNPDVAEAGFSPLVHFIKYGQSEGRYGNRSSLSADAAKIIESGLFDPPAHETPRRGIVGIPAVERYLAGWRFGYRGSAKFDDEFYHRTYEDARSSGKPPFIHFLEVGKRQHRPVNQKELSEAVSRIHYMFDVEYYRKQAGLPDLAENLIEHYLTVGRFRGFDPSPNFSAAYYLRVYPDVAENGIDPFIHYAVFSPNEKRIGRPSFLNGRISGSQSYDPARPSVIVVNHDASRTGAPLVGLEVARHLFRHCNVFIYSMRKGELIDEFASLAVQVYVGSAGPIEAEFFFRDVQREYGDVTVVLNSAETSAFASAALYVGVPSVALVHEFAEYTFPPGTAAKIVAAADRVVVPAKLVFNSVQREVGGHFGAQAANVVIRPQGCLHSLPGRAKDGGDADLTAQQVLALIKPAGGDKPPVVLGAGFVHMRKGVELFVQAAHEVRRYIEDVRFIWVGAGYAPQADETYSVWVSEMVRRLGLEDCVFFLPPQSQLDTLFGLCDAFFLSSRLDPFPSVVLDALEAGKQVVCFDNATGAAELFQSGAARGAVVEYVNAAAAGDALVNILTSPAGEGSAINRSLVEEKFQFADYAGFLEQQIEQAQRLRTEARAACDRIIASKAFDPQFHDGGSVFQFDLDKPVQDYVARATKGLAKFSPRPGFNDGLYRSRIELKAGEVPFDHALRYRTDDEVPSTHCCIALQRTVAPKPVVGRIALHLHLFYPELADEFVQRLDAAGYPIDLFVTTPDESRQAELQQSFSQYRHGQVHYILVENRGRDIGPFLTHLGAPFANGNYDLVGHLHAKRSLAVDAAMGERWRTYLLDTLLGDTFSHLLSLFADDEKLGLVFAEDRHAAGWNANFDIASGLAAKTTPRLTLPPYPYFPLGTMFWARRAAMAPLWTLDLHPEDFPAEPVHYDGTILHAIERLLPACCEAAGFSWCSVYDRRIAW
jgi:glycosyltransferase involved in cell wall biosynthesis